MDKAPIALILAAGFSRRFGSDKRQVALHGGVTLLQQTCARIAAAGLESRLVLREGDDCKTFGVPTIRIPVQQAERGMGATLAASVAQLDGATHGCLVCLGDMPFIEARTYAAIASALQPLSIIVPHFNAVPGNPVAFSSDYLDELGQLDGDRGARALLKRHAGQVIKLDVADPGVHRDVDTVANLLQW